MTETTTTDTLSRHVKNFKKYFRNITRMGETNTKIYYHCSNWRIKFIDWQYEATRASSLAFSSAISSSSFSILFFKVSSRQHAEHWRPVINFFLALVCYARIRATSSTMCSGPIYTLGRLEFLASLNAQASTNSLSKNTTCAFRDF